MKTCNLPPATPYTAMSNFNYSAPAELFGSPGRQRRSVSYRRFASGAEAIRFAVEGISAALLAGVTLQSEDDRFDHRAIRALYDGPKYPLSRQRGTTFGRFGALNRLPVTAGQGSTLPTDDRPTLAPVTAVAP